MKPEFELVLTTESKVVSTNLKPFEEQANHYLANLTQIFETDDDFAQAKEETKELKIIEDKIREAIKKTHNGEIVELISTAENIAERFRHERIEREKIIKTKEAEIKKQIADKAIEEISDTSNKLVKLSDISLALEITMPKASISKRIEESQKTKRTIDSLTKSVNAEKMSIISEMSIEIGRLTERLDQINAKSAWLFPDAVKLIATQDELTPIIQQRIAEEEQRTAEIKAKAEQEYLAKDEAEKIKAEAKVITDEMEQQAIEKPQEFAKTETTEQVNDFVITIRLTQTTQAQAIEIARSLKARFGDCVSLNKTK